MPGIYIHIPFCKQACNYCNFHFSTLKTHREEMIKAMQREITMRRGYLSKDINTIYFGGGTPSILSSKSIEDIILSIKDIYTIEHCAEITLEANPDDITPEKLSEWKRIGINRLSIGVQSFFEEDLRWMNRAHSADQSLKAINDAISEGFNNITIDLIYGLPGMSDERWLQNIRTAIELGVQHLSCYALTVEVKTVLYHLIQKHKVPDVDAEKQSRHFEILVNELRKHGYEHYEISNFAKPGFRSMHNSSYWNGEPYIGIGPSAHSFDGKSRQWNVSNNASYIESVNSDIIPCEVEMLTMQQRINEYIMISLRTSEGLSLKCLGDIGAEVDVERVKNQANKYIINGMLLSNEGYLKLTDRGKFFADGIASDLFFI